MDYKEQLKIIQASSAWNRMQGILLIVPTELDQRDLVSSRLSHTLEVMEIGEQVADVFSLDVEMVRLIGAVHDIAHLPYGHYSEQVIACKLFPCKGLSVNHNENGPEIYASLVGHKNVDTAVVCGIREHRSVDRFHSTLESWAVAHADEIATLISDIRDGLSLPTNGGSHLDECEVVLALEGTILAGKAIDEWARILITQLILDKNNCRISWNRVLGEVFTKLNELRAKVHSHPWVKAEELQIVDRLRICFQSKEQEGFTPQEVIHSFLLHATEPDMFQFV
ncbi:HD domain-containing protein [Thermodesulfobacteriota bacterium]